MISIDTNILIRWITLDDSLQCKKVELLFSKHNKFQEIFISDIVLIELEWVLASVYKFERKSIIHELHRIVRVNQFCFRNKKTLLKAIDKFSNGAKDFSDCLIGEVGQELDCKTYTFDKALRENTSFVLL